MDTLRIEPYKLASQGAKALSRYTGILRVTPAGIRRHGSFTTLINWGNSERRFTDATYINDPEAVTIASDKLRSYQKFRESGVATAWFTTSRDEAEEWSSDGSAILARTYLRASGGRGITYYAPGYINGESGEEHGQRQDESERDTDGGETAGRTGGGTNPTGRDGRPGRRRLVEAPLYIKYIKKADEYRVHVFDGVVIDIQQKRKRQEIPNEQINYQIRNSDNGWVYCRDNVDCPNCVLVHAIRAVDSLGLDFGAVDVGYNSKSKRACVYEVNTAPGLEGTTLTRYQAALERRFPRIGRGAFARRRHYGGGGSW